MDRIARLIAGGISLAAMAGSAMAADLLPEPAPAPDASCFYARIDGGATFHERPNVYKNHGGSKQKALGESLKDTGFIEGGFGCQFTPMFRADIVGGYRFGSKLKDDWNSLDAKLSTGTLFANGYVDFGQFGAFRPYVGAGVGVAFHHLGSVDLPIGSSSGNSTSFAWNAQAGVVFDLTDRLALDVGYRYVDLGKAKSGGPLPFKVDDITAHEARIGLRYSFN